MLWVCPSEGERLGKGPRGGRRIEDAPTACGTAVATPTRITASAFIFATMPRLHSIPLNLRKAGQTFLPLHKKLIEFVHEFVSDLC